MKVKHSFSYSRHAKWLAIFAILCTLTSLSRAQVQIENPPSDAAPTSSEEILFADDFESSTPGSSPAQWTQSLAGAWQVKAPGLNASTAHVAAKVRTSGDNFLSRDFEGSPELRVTFRTKSGPATNARWGKMMLLAPGMNLSNNSVSIFLMLENDGQIHVNDGLTFPALVAYQPNTEYLISIDADCNKATFFVTINGVRYDNGGGGFAFRYSSTGNPNLGRLFWSNNSPSSGGGEVALDDVMVTRRRSNLTVASPVPYQILQRNSNGTRDIVISGTYAGNAAPIEASWNGAPWRVITTSLNDGVFQGVLPAQPAGQGTLLVRQTGSNEHIAVKRVSVGDVYAVWGQSNASGRALTKQLFYSSLDVHGAMLGNDYRWRELRDPVDDNTGQLDLVSRDSENMGSIWPLVGSALTIENGVPVAFIPCAVGSTSIAQWQPGADHFDRRTLYGSALYRCHFAGGIKAVLWWQGERDAMRSVSASYYLAQLKMLAGAIQNDLGVKLMACTLPQSAITASSRNSINFAIVRASAEGATLPGPDVSDLFTDDDLHLQSVEKTNIAARRWTKALQAAALSR